jgi:hypothetical protein
MRVCESGKHFNLQIVRQVFWNINASVFHGKNFLIYLDLMFKKSTCFKVLFFMSFAHNLLLSCFFQLRREVVIFSIHIQRPQRNRQNSLRQYYF